MVTPNDITNVVSDITGIKVSTLCGRGQTRTVADARHLAMWAIRKYVPRHTLNEIAKMFGRRDHTTVLHAIRKVTALKQYDRVWQVRIGAVSSMLAAPAGGSDG